MTFQQSNSPVSNGLYGVANGVTSSGPFITVLMTRDPTPNDNTYPVKQRWINTTTKSEWILKGFNNSVSFQDPSGNTVSNPGHETLALWLQLSSGSFSINVITQTVAGSYTYTPSDGMEYCIVEVQGGGGGGGGAQAAGGNQSCGAGGGAGAYGRGVFSSTTIGASQPYIVGAGGAGGTNVGGNGQPGQTSSFGTLISCSAGAGGDGSPADSTAGATAGGAGGTASGAGLSFGITGSNHRGEAGWWINAGGTVLVAYAGEGASSFLGSGGHYWVAGGNAAVAGGIVGLQGAGGGGGICSGNGNAAGGAGGAGVVIITEYIFN